MRNTKEAGTSLPQLTQEAPKEQLKAYFQKIYELRKSGERFPVNFDDVWQLVYVKKQKALIALKKDLVEGEDFLLTQLDKQDFGKWGGHNKQEVMLSVPALEYFIAKKVKHIFEVYRQVFHQIVDEKIAAMDGHRDGELFSVTIGNTTLRTVYKNGRQWWEMAPVIRALRGRGEAGVYVTKAGGEEGCMRITVGKIERWFINRQGIHNLNVQLSPPADKMAAVKHSLFTSDKPSDGYFFTFSQMSEIMFALNRSPIKRTVVSALLEKGKKGGML